MVVKTVVNYLIYLRKLAFSERYLLATNMTISLALSTTGDIIEQRYELYRGTISEWNRQRTAHMALSGMIVGFICHYWYKILDQHLPQRNFRVVIKKIILDQLICSPLYMSAFFLTMGVLERKTLVETWLEMRTKFPRLYIAEWTLWPPAQYFSFFLLPRRYRVLYDNLVSLLCDVYTSKIKHGETNGEENGEANGEANGKANGKKMKKTDSGK